MSSPVNLGDAIALLAQIYKAYDAYRSTPDQVRQVFKRLEDTEKECQSLNKILASSRHPDLRSWPGTEDFITDLEAARAYLSKYHPLTNDGITRMARVKQTTLMKWEWSQFEKHTASIDRHRDNMKDFKQTVLIQTAQANIELQIAAIRLQLKNQAFSNSVYTNAMCDDRVSIVSDTDHVSLLSKASRSLQAVRALEATPHVQRRLPLSPVLESSGSLGRRTKRGGNPSAADAGLPHRRPRGT